MSRENKIKKICPVEPSEGNSYCIFEETWEENPLILFHMTDKSNLSNIQLQGFRSAAELGTGSLESVSYSKNSSGCFANLGNTISNDSVVFAVEFDTLCVNGIEDKCSEIHVYIIEVQPSIKGYCELPKGFCIA